MKGGVWIPGICKTKGHCGSEVGVGHGMKKKKDRRAHTSIVMGRGGGRARVVMCVGRREVYKCIEQQESQKDGYHHR